MQTWQPLTMDSKNLITTIQTLHHTAQFLAMASNSYLPKQPDDSQNNFKWNSETNCFEGRWVDNPTLRILLDVQNFELVVDKFIVREIIPLDGWTTEQVLSNLIIELKMAGLDPTVLKPINQYTIEYNSPGTGNPLRKPTWENLAEWAHYLSNAQLVLEEIKTQFEWASEVRVWPHHFDMGLYIPISKDAQGRDLQSIGLGLAMPDVYSTEPYFYINHRSKKTIIYPEHLPAVRSGYWNMKDWKGLILPASAILLKDLENQENFVRTFLEKGMATTLSLMAKKENSVIY